MCYDSPYLIYFANVLVVNSQGTMVSSHVQGIYDMHSDAKFVLVVEKEASFQRLMDDNVLQKLHPCIVITVSTCTTNK